MRVRVKRPKARPSTWKRLRGTLRALFALGAKRYRPEKFYMRGPGPKSRRDTVQRA